ncbi:biotin-dependent carboxyltransferase family protein [Planctomonas deserti]|uniref:5-oxoprolinase subunit C family protein n=1 Tax=Planctomonas deserti TaxID=2144185 RepID=UPI000D3C8F4D|nr:biotin-dependent carboxyltransferase family protein [Planctomonas deserti]
MTAGGRGAAGELRIERSGPLLLIQDAGRPGQAALGVPASGALDPVAAAAANRLVGNGPSSAVLELLLGGALLRASAPTWIAVTGAAGALEVQGPGGVRPAPWTAAFRLDAGEALAIGPAQYGVRYYLAVRGGVGVPATLGSRSSDTLSGLGPAPLRDGDVVPVGGVDPIGPVPPLDLLPASAPPAGEVTLRVLPGPRLDWFAASAWDALRARSWTVTAEADRVGVRLDGPPLERVRDDELPSEGVVTGALQVPPSGLPILFLADHPVTGGYPVVGVVRRVDVRLASQLRPGQAVRFR